MGLSLSSIQSFESFKPQEDKDAKNQQKSAAQRLRSVGRLTLLELDEQIENLIAFSHKKYTVDGQITNHYQIEILARRRGTTFDSDNRLNYFVILFTFNKDGLIIKNLENPYRGRKKELKRQEGFTIKKLAEVDALNKLLEICKEYQKQQYSLIWFTHCRQFANSIRSELKQYSQKETVSSLDWIWIKRKQISDQQKSGPAEVLYDRI